MPTPPLDPAAMLEALNAYEAEPTRSKQKAAESIGIHPATFTHRLNKAQAIGRKALESQCDPAVQDSMAAANTNLVPHLAWVKTKSEDGTSYSVLLKPEQGEQDLIDRIRSAFHDLPPAPSVEPPDHAEADLVTVYPIADRHNGLRAWARETGEAYDTTIAQERLTNWMGRCVAQSPKSQLAVILDIGDGEHMDDATNVTPRSKHVLDVDTRVFKTVETSVASLAHCVEMALAHHERVIVRILPGNHNPTLYLAVMFALAERYRNEPRVEVQKVPGEFWVFEFGDVMLAAHHGDKAKAERMVLFLADEYPEVWGKTKHRYLFTGHLHHHKSQDIGGVTWEQLRAVTARDAYAVSHAYSARAQLQAITLHKDRGEISRVKVSA